MKHQLKIRTVWSMEASRFFQNRNLLASTLLFAPIMVILMLWTISCIESDSYQPCVEIYGASDLAAVITAEFEETATLFFEDAAPDGETRKKVEKNKVVIATAGETVDIYYDSSSLTDPDLLNTALKAADSILALRIGNQCYTGFLQEASAIRRSDISTVDDRIELILIPLVLTVFVVTLMLINMSIGNLSADAVAGERERGTLDMLRLSGTTPGSIIMGKYGFIVLIGTLVLILQSIALVLGLYLFQRELFHTATEAATAHPLWFLPVALSFFCIATISVSLCIAISVSFKTMRQASAYMSIAQIVLSLFSYAPNVLDQRILSYLPISNMAAVIKTALTGGSTTPYLVGSTCISLAITVPALVYASFILKKDSIR